jgi:hypothetical protein
MQRSKQREKGQKKKTRKNKKKGGGGFKEMACNISADHKPHVVCIPTPAQSHIKSVLKLAKLLHYKGFHITFVNTEFNHRRLLKSRGPDSMNGLPDFRFESIPDGLPPSDENATQNTYAICEASRKNLLGPFNDLLDKLNDTASSDAPPVTCIVSDGFMPVAIDAAAMHEIPIALFFTISACSFMGIEQFQALKEKGLTPLKGMDKEKKNYSFIKICSCLKCLQINKLLHQSGSIIHTHKERISTIITLFIVIPS